MSSQQPDDAQVSSEAEGATTTTEEAKPRRKPRGVTRALAEIIGADGTPHPALLPGIGVADTDKRFGVDWWVFGAAGIFIIIFVGFGLTDSEALGTAATTAVHWVSLNTGWLFSGLTILVFLFMLVIGFSAKGRIRLGRDNEEPEFSTFSWVAMLFSAGMGIGLLFFGPYEPLAFFIDQPPAFDLYEGSIASMRAAMAQTLLHWGPMAWSYYALVGGAIAYSTYRRGRSSVVSAIFDPIFSERLKIPFGRVIDIFAILVTLFGTAVSLGLGAMQIGRGIEIVGGIGDVGNAIIVGLMVVLTIAFIFSAVSGVKRGIRALSNINMILALGVGVFVFITGPTLFLLDFIPSSLIAFFTEIGPMFSQFASADTSTAEFMESWTTYYWAWWVSWTPFVGMFIAKISRGRTLREFVTVVIILPSIVCLLWFGTLGGTSMWMESRGYEISGAEDSQDILFEVLGNLPLPMVISVIAMLSLVIFFVTSADSASIVMASISEKGRPTPSKPITIIWGVALSATAITLFLAGGEDALSALQALVTISALPFAIVLFILMYAWWKDLSTDPLILRREYAQVAIDEGIRRGIREYGDDFVFSSGPTARDRGAGAWLDTHDPSLTLWYEEALVAEDNAVVALEDVAEAAELAAERLDEAVENLRSADTESQDEN